ncbi:MULTISPECIES: Rieske 2Fe-2S domain-containing protein [unclassified Frankia]|uniref:Rieske 2Fe-2S domain-containing protein n=1 Tax=unclassified Frankia TaxID=2632575 RepID=UPI000E2F6352|nr:MULTISPECIES: Rieske 2Fe-2S domain-containing protein [unclassified Frankia]
MSSALAGGASAGGASAGGASAGGTTVAWTDVASLDEVWEGDVLEVTAGAEQVLLAHLPGGALRAYQAVCPHSRFPLVNGAVEDGVLTCAAHHWEFDLATGESLNPSDCRLYSFPVRADGERIIVGIPPDGRRHYHRCRGDATAAPTGRRFS